MGIDNNKLGIVRYNKELYQKVFEQEQQRLKAMFDTAEIIHFGSTAVGVPGKPIVDIMLVYKGEGEYIKKLEELEYEFVGDIDIAGTKASKLFILGNGTYNVYLHLVKKNKFYHSALKFKKILKENEDVKKIYSRLKQGLEKLSGSRDSYVFHKSAFIETVIEAYKDGTVDLKVIQDKRNALTNHLYIVQLLTELGLYKQEAKIK